MVPNFYGKALRPFTFWLNPPAQAHLLVDLVPLRQYPQPSIILFDFVLTVVIEQCLVPGSMLSTGDIKMNNNWHPTLKDLTVAASLDIIGMVQYQTHYINLSFHHHYSSRR